MGTSIGPKIWAKYSALASTTIPFKPKRKKVWQTYDEQAKID